MRGVDSKQRNTDHATSSGTIPTVDEFLGKNNMLEPCMLIIVCADSDECQEARQDSTCGGYLSTE